VLRLPPVHCPPRMNQRVMRERFLRHTAAYTRRAPCNVLHAACITRQWCARLGSRFFAMTNLRIATSEISGGRSLTRPFRDARRFLSLYMLVPGLTYTRTARKSGICPSFKGHFLSPRAQRYDSQLFTRRSARALALEAQHGVEHGDAQREAAPGAGASVIRGERARPSHAPRVAPVRRQQLAHTHLCPTTRRPG
jgi:hypothetical protein